GGDVEGHDPQRHRDDPHVGEPGVAQPPADLGRRRVGGDRARQVRVRLAARVEQAAHGGEHAGQVERVDASEQRHADVGELEDHVATAGTQHAVCGAHRGGAVDDVAQPEADGDGVDAGVGDAVEPGGVTLAELDALN